MEPAPINQFKNGTGSDKPVRKRNHFKLFLKKMDKFKHYLVIIYILSFKIVKVSKISGNNLFLKKVFFKPA